MAKRRYTVEYVGGENLPTGGLNPSLARFGGLIIGESRPQFLTEEQAAEGARIPGVKVDLIEEPKVGEPKKSKARRKKS